MDNAAPFVADVDIDVRVRNSSRRPYRHDEEDVTIAATASEQGKIKDRSASTDEQTSLLGSESEDSSTVAEGSEDEADGGYRGPPGGDFSGLVWWRRPSVRMHRYFELIRV